MFYTIEDIARTLKGAREAKGLSQRTLSAKTGLTQTHISKIENASIDLRLSNLMELARTLDLEVMLVPRRAVPAAQGLVRNIETAKQTPVDAGKTVRRLQHAVQTLAILVPPKGIERLQELSRTFENFRLNADQIQKLQDTAKEFQRISASLQKMKLPEFSIPQTDMQKINQITNQLREMRNAIVHAASSENMNRIQPAYRLEEGGSDG
jgi:transcriptional regulator with XRE-family HTH domain